MIAMSNSKSVVVYHYFEKDQSYIDNFCHFLRFGYRLDMNFVIVVAGHHTIDLPKAANLQYHFAPNMNFDFGGYASAIRALDLLDHYEHFIFVNSSVRGPFSPPYIEKSWDQILIDLLEPDVGVAGTAIALTPAHHSIAKLYHAKYGVSPSNEEILAHVQSTCYVLPKNSLQYLVNIGFYEGAISLSKDETVRDYEIRLSQLLLAQGLTLKCVLPEYNQPDYREPESDINPSSREGDSGFRNSYFGRTVHPYESMFIKTSRNTYSDQYLKQLAHSMASPKTIVKGFEDSEILSQYDLACQASITTTDQGRDTPSFWKKLVQVR
jgi:hypothetical protein